MANPQRSIDGFVPSSQGRRVGFNYDARSHTFGNGAVGQRIPRRRPSLHAAPAVQTTAPQMLQAASQPEAQQFGPEFKSIAHNGQLSGGRFGAGAGAGAGASNAPRKRRFGGTRRNKGGRPTKSGSFLHRISWKKVFKRTGLVLGVFVLVIGVWFGWRIAKTTTRVFGDNSSVLGFLSSSTLKGEDKGRVNMLLAGVSSDDPGHEGGELTDSIMLVSLDTKNHKALLLSIPRDLWVNIPGNGYSKINAANVFGESDSFSEPGYPNGGMGLLEQTVSQNFGIPIHYYAKINYTAFRDAVNAVGGITVDIKSSDKRGLYDPNISYVDKGPLKLANGVQKLDGQTALNLARARGDPPGDGRMPYGFNSDFSRTEHQRQMLVALKEKITTGGVITNPLKVSELFDVVGKNMKTDLKPGEIRRLYDLNKQTKGGDVESLSLNDAGGVNLLVGYNAPNGSSALRPAAGLDNFSQIQLYLKKVMTNDPVIKEAAKVVVLNGGTISGLATKEAAYLTSKGFNVVAIDDAPPTTGPNVIIDQTVKTSAGASGKAATKARLQQIYGSSGTTATGVGYATADFIVIIGTDQKARGQAVVQ